MNGYIETPVHFVVANNILNIPTINAKLQGRKVVKTHRQSVFGVKH